MLSADNESLDRLVSFICLSISNRFVKFTNFTFYDDNNLCFLSELSNTKNNM